MRIVATRPEPTVLPPSRFSVVEIRVILCDFQGFFGGFFFDMHPVSDVFGFFVIMVLSRSELCLAALHPFATCQTNCELLRNLFPKLHPRKNPKNHIIKDFALSNCELLRIYCGLYVQRICQCRIMFITIHFYYPDFQ